MTEKVWREPIIGRQLSLKNNFNFQKLIDAPCLMSIPQRLMLFTLVAGTAPRRYLEIGPGRGGSARIVRYAIECIGDPEFRGCSIGPALQNVLPEVREAVEDRFEFIEGFCGAPSVMQAHRSAGGDFDIILIDALHDLENARFDAMTTFPYLAPGGVMLFDDANYYEIRDAVDECIRMLPVDDCGYISRHGGRDEKNVRPENDRWQGEEGVWGGMYMLRKHDDAPSMSEKKSGPMIDEYVVLKRKY